MTLYSTYIPQPPLADFVNLFWLYEGYTQPHTKERVLPDGSQEVLHLIGKGQQVEWADIAFSCGYFDQAHFIHNFRDFSGLNPSGYLAGRGEHLNHVPLGA